MQALIAGAKSTQKVVTNALPFWGVLILQIWVCILCISYIIDIMMSADRPPWFNFADPYSWIRFKSLHNVHMIYRWNSSTFLFQLVLCRLVLMDKSEDAMVRHEAAEALGSIAAPDCLKLLEDYCQDPESIVADSCIVALDMLHHEASNDWQYALTEIPVQWGLSGPCINASHCIEGLLQDWYRCGRPLQIQMERIGAMLFVW